MEVGDSHVPLRPLETEDEVLREDVFAVARIDEYVREWCRCVADVLSSRKSFEQAGDVSVDGSPWLRGRALRRVDGVDGGEVGLVVDDECRDVFHPVLDVRKISHQVFQNRSVLLHDDESCPTAIEVLFRVCLLYTSPS